MKFQYYKDKKYFAQICCNGNMAKLKDYEVFFDFRDPLIKRAEFNQNKRGYFPLIVQKYGKQCMLKISDDCTLTTNLVIDHFIPLSSNELNKKLRDIRPKEGKKVPSQSFGSNKQENLVIACSKCNSIKKHKLPTPELWQRVIQGQKGL